MRQGLKQLSERKVAQKASATVCVLKSVIDSIDQKIDGNQAMDTLNLSIFDRFIRSRGSEFAARLVKHEQFAFVDGEPRAVEADRAGGLAFPDAGEGAQIGKADLHRFMLHCPDGSGCRFCAMPVDNLFPRIVQHFDPARDEAAFAGLGILEILRKRRSTAAAGAMAHDEDFRDLQLGDSKFQRSRYAVPPAAQLERRDEVGDIANDKHLSRRGVEYGRRIDPAVRTGDHHDVGRLPFRQFRPAAALRRPAVALETMIAGEQIGKIGHDRRGKGRGRGWQVLPTGAKARP